MPQVKNHDVSWPEILLISLALSADAFSVGAAVALNHRSARQTFRLAFHFGLFQSLMSLSGILAGGAFIAYIRNWDHWLALAMLGAIGLKMIVGHFKEKDAGRSAVDLTRGGAMVGLSLAVSVDALAVGVGLAAADFPRAMTVTAIGAVAFLATAASMRLAGALATRIGGRLEPVAGLFLIGLGVKIVIDHLS